MQHVSKEVTDSKDLVEARQTPTKFVNLRKEGQSNLKSRNQDSIVEFDQSSLPQIKAPNTDLSRYKTKKHNCINVSQKLK